MEIEDGKNFNWTEHYAVIGKYVTEFEKLVNEIRFESSVLFQLRGLKDWTLSSIVFGQRMFTANPLITCFESLCNELFPENKDLLNKLSKFSNAFKKQIENRNDLLHSTYLIGDHMIFIGDKKRDPKQLEVLKNSPTKKGNRIKRVVNSIQDIENHIEELSIIEKEFRGITSGILNYMYEKK